MKQKIVVEVCVRCEKCRTTALSIAAVRSGVISVQIGGEDKNQVTVIGENVDSVSLTACLRKKLGSARLVSVEQGKAEEDKKKDDDKEKDEKATILPYYYYTTPRYYSQPRVYYCDPLYDSNPCSIM